MRVRVGAFLLPCSIWIKQGLLKLLRIKPLRKCQRIKHNSLFETTFTFPLAWINHSPRFQKWIKAVPGYVYVLTKRRGRVKTEEPWICLEIKLYYCATIWQQIFSFASSKLFYLILLNDDRTFSDTYLFFGQSDKPFAAYLFCTSIRKCYESALRALKLKMLVR